MPNQAEMTLQSPKIWLPKPCTHHNCGICLQQIPLPSLLTMLWFISERALGSSWLTEVNAKSLDKIPQRMVSAKHYPWPASSSGVLQMHRPGCRVPSSPASNQVNSIGASPPAALVRGILTGWATYQVHTSQLNCSYVTHQQEVPAVHFYKPTAQCWWLGFWS